jgi:hypothetical protein
MSIIRGSYNGLYNGLAIGNTQVGFRKSYSYQGRNINFDAVGQTPVDIIFAGLQMKVGFVAQEYDAAAIDILRWPFHSIPGRVSPQGLSMWEQAKPLLLTACRTTNIPQAILFPKAILAPDYTIDLDYSHTERPLPMSLVIFPVRYNSEDPEYETPLIPSGCGEVVWYVEVLDD